MGKALKVSRGGGNEGTYCYSKQAAAISPSTVSNESGSESRNAFAPVTISCSDTVGLNSSGTVILINPVSYVLPTQPASGLVGKYFQGSIGAPCKCTAIDYVNNDYCYISYTKMVVSTSGDKTYGVTNELVHSGITLVDGYRYTRLT